ncbi:MAG TPA: hypothetical protein VMM83_05825 [Longimicrobiales bacterium]|nr:hypothetical protein [Longimicrobiales bacterium]
MHRLKVAGRVAVLAATLPLSGCAAAFGGYDLAPNGLPRDEEALRHSLAVQADELYGEITGGERPLPDDDLLRLLYAGTAGYYSGNLRESSRLLDLAMYLAEDRVTFSVSRQTLSMVTSDRTLAYTPGRTERLMIPYMAALTYLEAGDFDGAAVEARRIEALLDRLDEGVPPDETPPDSRFLHYFAGTVFEAAREWNGADVAYRRSGPLGELLGHGLERDGGAPADSLGDVVVLVEHGFVPHPVEQSVVVVLPPSQVAMLTEGSAGEKAAAAAEAAARILVAASRAYGDRSGYYHDRGYRSDIRLEPWGDDPCDSGRRRSCEDEDGTPYLLRISWPVLYQEPSPSTPLRVRVGDLGVDAAARLDLAACTRRDFEAARPEVLARTVLRAATKMGLTASVEAAVEKKDQAAGQLLGILTNLGTLLTERADTRAWHLLPGSVSLVRLRLPAGSHELTVEADPARGGRGGGEALGSVRVRPGTTTFVSTRLWR